jgi:hypothetical protein
MCQQSPAKWGRGPIVSIGLGNTGCTAQQPYDVLLINLMSVDAYGQLTYGILS